MSTHDDGNGDVYGQILARVFASHYVPGATSLAWRREEINEAASALGVPLPKNPGDVVYAFRYRRPLPEPISATAPPGRQWVLRGAGRSRYSFDLVSHPVRITPNPLLSTTKIPDATPQIISASALGDEQALLAVTRYNRLVDVFLGLTTYSLQSHLRTTAPGIGQVEIDEVYVALDSRGRQYVVPVQAKGGRDEIGVTQVEQDLAVCASKWPTMIARPVAIQFIDDTTVAMFELEQCDGEVRLRSEAHYLLVPAEEINETDLERY